MASFSILWIVIALRISHAYGGLVHCNCKLSSEQKGEDVTVTCNNIRDLEHIKVMECKESSTECDASLTRLEVTRSNKSLKNELGLLTFHHANRTSELRLYRRQNSGCYCMTVVAGNGYEKCNLQLEGKAQEQTPSEHTPESGTQTSYSNDSVKPPEMYQDSPRIWYLPLIIVAAATVIALYIYMKRRRTGQTHMNESMQTMLEKV
ncbi:uncharacterized protein XB22064859.L [Xenopus laevis]|uniref:Immunoglobulin subtype domain-containing protein n=2 Tax=Xenopus laevis TaxID=8355 RepID=A0A974BY83_XENLA|nr:uncharacterized protein XB22064859.L [Xenopus laevis]OCT63040.1 hypothetical protein XELAEV_18044134mg [Xenopus laevis]